MRRRALLSLCLCLALQAGALQAGAAEVLFYRSNSAGMLLERIPPYRRDESPWVVSVQRSGSQEIRVLLDNGKEVRRWEDTSSSGRTIERELADGVLSARRVYDSSGSLLEEESYDAGKLTQSTTYTYSGGRLVRAQTSGPDGSVLYTDRFLYATNGSLRSVRRSGPSGGAQEASVVAGSGGVFELRTGSADGAIITRYDSRGRLASREERSADAVVTREDFTYSASGALSASTERRPADGTTIQRSYDAKGLVIQETTTSRSGSAVVDSWTRDPDGHVLSRTRRGPKGLELWKYSLGADGAVAREEYYQRGSLEKVTIYGEGGKRTEELYQDGELFLRVLYDGDTRVSEEVWSDGTLVRTRTYP